MFCQLQKDEVCGDFKFLNNGESAATGARSTKDIYAHLKARARRWSRPRARLFRY